MLGAPVAVVAVAYAVAYVMARSRASDDFWTSYAASIGFTLLDGEHEPTAFTPLLGAGDRRGCERWMRGEVEDRLAYLGLYRYSDQERDSDGDTHWEHHDFTIGVVAVEPTGVPWVSGLYLHERGLLGGRFSESWVPWGTRQLETESSAFRDRYVIRAEDGVDEVRVRELFSPSFLDRLSRHPRRPCFEYRAGVLVVFQDGHAADAGTLTALLDTTREIAARIAQEVAESGRPG